MGQHRLVRHKGVPLVGKDSVGDVPGAGFKIVKGAHVSVSLVQSRGESE